jgi:hypothetical protein
MSDLSYEEAQQACELARACCAACMQICSAALHYDILYDISKAISQHAQRTSQPAAPLSHAHPADNTAAPLTSNACHNPQQRACCTSPALCRQKSRVIHSFLSASGNLQAGKEASSSGRLNAVAIGGKQPCLQHAPTSEVSQNANGDCCGVENCDAEGEEKAKEIDEEILHEMHQCPPREKLLEIVHKCGSPISPTPSFHNHGS